MKKFCTIQHLLPGGKPDVMQVFFDRPDDVKRAAAFWTKCVTGKMPKTKPQDWKWDWA